MTVMNKLVLSQYEFKCNFLLLGTSPLTHSCRSFCTSVIRRTKKTAIQSLVCVGLVEGFTKFGVIEHRPFKWAEGKAWMVVAVALVAMVRD